MKNCEICDAEMASSNRTCSKICKNKLASQITNKQMSNPTAKEHLRQKSLSQKSDPVYQANAAAGMKRRTARWKEQGHPRIGMSQPESAKKSIGKANTGRFKGKTWEEIFGSDVAARRKIENSLSMSAKNEILLKKKRSKLEERLLPYLPRYRNNIQVSYYNVDFIDETTKHIIEVYGDYWHCNPSKYADDFMHPYFKMTAIARRELDKERVVYLESLGYSVTIVWESDLNTFIRTLEPQA